MPIAKQIQMPAPAAHGALAIGLSMVGITNAARNYPRFAALTANQKAQARDIWRDSTRENKTPLVDCYFTVTELGNVTWLWWVNPNR